MDSPDSVNLVTPPATKLLRDNTCVWCFIQGRCKAPAAHATDRMWRRRFIQMLHRKKSIWVLFELAAWSALRPNYKIFPLCDPSLHLINSARYLLQHREKAFIYLGICRFEAAMFPPQPSSPTSIEIYFNNSLFTKCPEVDLSGNGQKQHSQS